MRRAPLDAISSKNRSAPARFYELLRRSHSLAGHAGELMTDCGWRIARCGARCGFDCPWLRSGTIHCALRSLVIPAKAGLSTAAGLVIQFLALDFALTASHHLSARIPRADHFFFNSEEKVTQKTPPPHRTSRAQRARCPARLGAGGPARTRASLRSDMRAFSPPSPAMLGAVKGEEDQKQKAKSFPFPAQRGKVPAGRKGTLLLLRAGARCSGFRVPITLRRQRSETPAGAARWIEPTSLPAQGCAVSEARPLTRTLRAGWLKGAMFWGVFSLVTFSCTSKRKSPARPQDEWKLLPLKQRAKSWIPAGMTSKKSGGLQTTASAWRKSAISTSGSSSPIDRRT